LLAATLPTQLLPIISTFAWSGSAEKKRAKVHVILDTGSTDNFITEETAKKLNLKLSAASVSLGGVGGKRTQLTQCTEFRLGLPGKTIEVPALVIQKICGEIEHLSPEKKGGEKGARMHRARVDVLLGVNLTLKAFRGGKEVSGTPGMHVLETIFGECFAGEIEGAESEGEKSSGALISNRDLDAALSKFFALETIGITRHLNDEKQAEELEAEQKLKELVRYENKRYVMPLLFKSSSAPLKNNLSIAWARLTNRERRLLKDPDARAAYNSTMKAYFDNGHARVIPEEEVDVPSAYYIPHSLVTRLEKETTKFRAVFDASCTGPDGRSLNSELLKTPVQTPAIPAIMLRFRRKAIALTADISKMFLQFPNRVEDRPYHRFLWREGPHEDVKFCELLTMTFGVADSPYKAIEGVRMHVNKYRQSHPEAVEELSRNLYIDDLIGGADTEDAAIKLMSDCTEILEEASLPMRKWVSSSKEVMGKIPPDMRGEVGKKLLTAGLADTELDSDGEAKAKALGLGWDVGKDILEYTGFTDMRDEKPTATKRSLASLTARLFDPMGYVCPFIVVAKLLIQEAWKLGLDWDEPINDDMQQRWLQWQEDLANLSLFSLPRQYQNRSKRDGSTKYTLHAFGDACDYALGCCVYIVSEYSDGTRESNLLMAKSKVASVKKMTLPRKELCAAYMAAMLLAEVSEALDLPLENAFCHTDSMTTFQWLQREPSQWLLFVANRCAKILEIAPREKWRWVPGEENPADLPSRGATPQALACSNLWKHGPDWLLLDACEWPPQPENVSALSSACLEERQKDAVTLVAQTTKLFLPPRGMERIWAMSDFSRLLRCTVYLGRFCGGKFLLMRGKKGAPRPTELAQAERWWIKKWQRHQLREEIVALEAGEPLRKGKSLDQLTPFLDGDGLLRVGGRLHLAELPYDTRHPIILPAVGRVRWLSDINDSLTARIIMHRHLLHQHAGTNWLLNSMRAEYWVIHGKQSISRVIRHCVACQKAIKGKKEQKMAPLPEARVAPYEVWTHVGLDYAGPFTVGKAVRRKRRKRGRPKKGETEARTAAEAELESVYVLLFTDMTSRAIHLEVTDGMEMEQFFHSFRRMISRRGIPRHLYSDEATTFVRGKMEISLLSKLARSSPLAGKLGEFGTEWHLNAPRAPHRGGAWERLVRSTKETLRKVLQGTCVDRTNFETVICEVEAFINDRPLCPPSENAEDAPAITPSLLTMGRKLAALPNTEGSDGRAPSRTENETAAEIQRKWKQRNSLAQQCWNAFITSYLLHVLPRSSKWTREHASLGAGDLVLVSTETTKRAEWPLARVVRVRGGICRGEGDRVRTVDLRFADGTLRTRAIQHLVHLEGLSHPTPSSTSPAVTPERTAPSTGTSPQPGTPPPAAEQSPTLQAQEPPADLHRPEAPPPAATTSTSPAPARRNPPRVRRKPIKLRE